MQFSERYGYKKIDKTIVWEEIPDKTRKRLWERINEYIFEPAIEHTNNNLLCQDFYNDMPQGLGMHMPEPGYLWEFLDGLYDRFFPPDFNELYTVGYTGVSIYREEKKCVNVKEKKQEIENWFKSAKWNEAFDFIDFLNKYYSGEEILIELNLALNKVLEEEKSAYRIINGIVTPLTDKEEVMEVEKALKSLDKFASVRVHMKKALELFSDKEHPDCQNAIKECMSALDSLVSVIKGKKTTFLKFAEALEIHKALKDGFLKLYAWSSDAEGIRHGTTKEELKPLIAEARYIIVTVSAFINYVVSKYGEGNIEERGNKDE